jgi:bla regulator protein BlaR1
MISFVLRHLLESTLFCLSLSFLACCLRNSATARHAVWLIGVAKFAIPSVLLASAGAEIAFFWPAASWLSSLANKVSTALLAVLDLLPVGIDAGVLVVWALGTAALLTVWLLRLRQRKHHPLALPTKLELDAMASAQALLAVRMPVTLRLSSAASEPAVWGIWHPTITIPDGLSRTLSAAEFEAVLLHELAHVRRFDNLSAVLVHCLVCLFWFHPLLWLIEKRLNVERERACDELVVACGTHPRVYAAGILKVCRFHLFETTAGVSAMTGGDLRHRLELILDSRVCARGLHVPRLLVATLALLMTLVPIAGGYCEQCVSNGQNPQPLQSLRSVR